MKTVPYQTSQPVGIDRPDTKHLQESRRITPIQSAIQRLLRLL
jgi:hypothetical protein